jgi:hypothetical protein
MNYRANLLGLLLAGLVINQTISTSYGQSSALFPQQASTISQPQQ